MNDVGDLYQKFGDEFPAEIERLRQQSMIPLYLRNATTFANLPQKEYSWLVNGLIPRDEVTMLTGDFGSLKSYIGLFIADAVASGGTFAGRPCQKCPVVILDRENSHQTLALRGSKVGGLQHRDNVYLFTLFTDIKAERTIQGHA